MPTPSTTRRWSIAAAGTTLQLCLGTVYAWSYFQNPLVQTYGWSNTQVVRTFSLAIFCLGLAAAAGGLLLPRSGPRRLAMIGALLFGAGHLVAALALHNKSLALLYLGYGLLGGTGLGLGYVTPVATVAKWFPDKKGLLTGMVIMGFGFGALLMSKVVAPLLWQASGGNLVAVFAWLGVGFMALATGSAFVLQNPPPDFSPSAADVTFKQIATSNVNNKTAQTSPAVSRSLRIAFVKMWIMFFANILVGISLISFLSPMFQRLWKAADPSTAPDTLVSYGATLIAVGSLFNGVGRMFWGGLSDRIGRIQVFRLMLASQIGVFVALTQVTSPWTFSTLICYVLLCYGGGFGTMPSFVSDVFGTRRMAFVYGSILTAWSAAGVAGPQFAAFLNDRLSGSSFNHVFWVNAIVLSIGLLAAIQPDPDSRKSPG